MQAGRIVSNNLKALLGLPVDNEGSSKNDTAGLFALYACWYSVFLYMATLRG